MKTLDLTKLDFPQNYELLPWGDQHIGNGNTSFSVIEKFVHYVKQRPDRYVTLGGDQFEMINIGDPRHDINLHDTRLSCVQDQRNAFSELFEPIADRILYMMEGNHEIDYVKAGQFQIARDIEDAFDLPFKHPEPRTNDGKGEAWYTVKALFPGWRLFQWHGPRRGTVNSQAMDPDIQEENEARSVKKKLRRFGHSDCDVLIMHHIHKMRIRSPVKYLQMTTDSETLNLKQHYNRPRRVYIAKDKREYLLDPHSVWYGSSGAALRLMGEGTSGYGEEAGYTATELGSLRIHVKNSRPVKVDKLVL